MANASDSPRSTSTRASGFGWALAYLAAASSAACGDECTAYDYAPPSARFRIMDERKDEALCDPDLEITADRGRPIPLEDLCEWWLPEWIPEEGVEEGADSVEVTLSLSGYAARTVTLPVSRDGCGEIQQPATVEVGLRPD